jgi:MFS family permease
MNTTTVIAAIPQKRIFYGWIIVAVSFLCWVVADAFGFYTFGLFIGPIGKELGWSTVAITGALTIKSITAGLLGPIIGYIADKKYGAKILMSTGILAAASSIMLVSQMHSLWQFYLFYGILGALGMVGFGGLVTHTIIAKWFIRMRGRAMAIASMGVSISGMIFIPLNQFLITNFGWRNALMICGFIILAVAFLPVVIFMKRRPEDMGLQPDGDMNDPLEKDGRESQGTEIPPQDEYSWSLKQALRTKTLYMLLIAFNVTGISISGVTIHFYPYIAEKGIAPELGATAMTLFAFCCAIIKIPSGFLVERIPARFCIIAVYTGCATGLALLLSSKSTIFVFLFAVVYGIALGGLMVLREVLFADYYGREFLGTIRGVVMPLNLLAMAGGPFFAAWIHDVSGGYKIPYMIFFSTFVIGNFFMFLAKPPAPPNRAL